MVVSKEQQAEDKMLNELAAMVKKLTTGMETLNGVQTQAVATMIKEIAQRNGISLTTKRHTLDVKRETELGHKALDVKEKLKIADTYLVRLRHRLNIQMEREHGQQVRRNINLRHNMDNFNEGLNKAKQAIMGGAGFQSALGTTVKKMAGMTRSYQEHEIAQKELATSTVEAQTAFDNLQMIMGDTVDEVTKQEGEVKTAELKLSGHEEQFKDTGKAAQGTQGMLKPLFEKLGKLGDFLGKKAVPIGIGVGVAGIFMSIIVKAFSASPLFAAMMKMMKFMVTLILMPIGTFFGALLRPILILLLRKFIIPMFSTWMPIMMSAGTQLGEWMTSWSWEKFIDAINSINPLYVKPETEEEKTARLIAEQTAREQAEQENVSHTDAEGNYISYEDSDQAFVKWINDTVAYWKDAIKKNQEENLKNNPFGIAADDGSLDGTEDGEPVKVEWDMSGESPMFNGKTPSDLEPDWEAIEREAGMYPVDQEAKDRAAAKAQLEAEAKEAREKPQKDMNNLMNEIIDTGTSMIDTVGFAARGEQTVNPNTGRLSSEAYSNAGISQTSLDERNEVRGNSDKNLGSTGSSIMDNYNAYLAGVVPAANGFDGMVNKPTMFLAGEAGVEHVSITPSGGSSGGITVNIQNMNGSDNDLRKLKKTILEVIQESSANRGRL